MATVRGVEPYESVFRNTLLDMMEGATPQIRWEGRRAWMAFMREHVADYLTRWPDLRDELVEILECNLAGGKGRASYRADMTAVLAVARTF